MLLALLLSACGGDAAGGTITSLPPSPAPPLAPADTVRSLDIAPGVRRTFRWEVAGPFAINVLEVDLAACGVSLRTIKGGDAFEGRETTSALAARLAVQQPRIVYGAVNADFFTAVGALVGAQVSDGDIVRAATRRPVVGISRSNLVYFGADVFTGTLRVRGNRTVEIGLVNERPDTLRVTLYNRFIGAATLTDPGALELVTQTVRPAGGVGDTTRAVVTRIDTAAAGAGVPANGHVLAAKGLGAAFLRANVSLGDTVSWVLRFAGAPPLVAEMVAGDPQLLRASTSLEPFAWVLQRDPRTAIGLTADRRLLLVTVDGRQPGFSVGMTLPELAALMRRLGATDALNVDGGGSSTMVVGGRVLNRPSDATGERAVANAIAVLGPAPGSCGR